LDDIWCIVQKIRLGVFAGITGIAVKSTEAAPLACTGYNQVSISVSGEKPMIIGIPKEILRDERRIALTPAGAYALVKAGHKVIVQSGAGDGCCLPTESYREAGATIVFSPEEAFARADVIVKIMPPTEPECAWIPEGAFLFNVVHLGTAHAKVHEMLRAHRVIAVGLELMEDEDRSIPIVTAMGEIAGMLLPQIAGRYLETTYGGRGVLLGGVAGIEASNVLILGAGNVGLTAARAFIGIGANVMIMDESLKRLRLAQTYLSQAATTILSTPYNIEHSTERADVLVGAIMIHGRRTPHIVSESMVAKMRPGSVLIDVSVDQGGCVETARPTTLSDPTFQ
jgi:alanine dehydrogenase